MQRRQREKPLWHRSRHSELSRMKPEGKQNQSSRSTKDLKMSFLIPSSINNNFSSRCPGINELGYTQGQHHKGEVTTSRGEALLSTTGETQMTDICNGNAPQEGNLSEDLQGWSVGSPSQKRLGSHSGNKRRGQFSRQPKDTLLSKTTTESPQAFPCNDIFLFWAKKVDDSKSKVPSRALGSQRPLKKRPWTASSRCGLSEEGREGVKGKGWPPSLCPEMKERKTRRELFPDSEVFRQLDAHVLHVSEQLNPKRGPLSTEALVPLITEGARSQLERVRAIWVWLCHNIEYDVDGFLGLSEKIHTPQQVLQTGRGVCSGYAHLCREMCREAGLTCVEVSGQGRGAEYSHGRSCLQQKSNHMWNAVELEGQWFLLDVCWGAGLVDVEKRLFTPRHDDFFFLTDPEDFVESHWPDDPVWQLLQPSIAREVFEKRVFKTPEFFKMELRLLSPDMSRLQTEKGEATVSFASPRSTEFAYQLLKVCPDGCQEDAGKTHGMLTMAEKRMSLRVFPPTEGLFDLQVFARPSGSQKPYSWVCSYQIECLESNGNEELPKSPFSFWGLHPRAKEFGITRCNWEDDLTLATTGMLKLALQTQRPLLATYEFVHQDLDESLSRKCLVSQAEDEKLSCHVLCPFLGYYRLSVFTKGLSEDEFKNTANFLIRCSEPINHNKLFPLGLSAHCGSGISSQWRGLSNPSHTDPIISTKKGQCTITFHTKPGFEVTATLDKDKIMNKQYPMERYVLITHLENKVSISVLLPESGLYRVGLYGRNAESEEFTHVCDYVIRCFTNPRWLPFPKIYSSWRRGCVLLQPRTGVLQEKIWVRFRVKMPKAYSVHVVGHSRMELKLGQNKVWEGDVYSGLAGSTLKVAAKFSRESPSMDVLLSFDVEGSSSTMDDSSG
nr:kyphoscoliosis peptidase-like [Pogona vitticeps]